MVGMGMAGALLLLASPAIRVAPLGEVHKVNIGGVYLVFDRREVCRMVCEYRHSVVACAIVTTVDPRNWKELKITVSSLKKRERKSYFSEN